MTFYNVDPKLKTWMTLLENELKSNIELSKYETLEKNYFLIDNFDSLSTWNTTKNTSLKITALYVTFNLWFRRTGTPSEKSPVITIIARSVMLWLRYSCLFHDVTSMWLLPRFVAESLHFVFGDSHTFRYQIWLQCLRSHPEIFTILCEQDNTNMNSIILRIIKFYFRILKWFNVSSTS